MDTLWKIKRALISVSDKTNLQDLCKSLIEHDVELIASGGTAKIISSFGFAVTPVEKITGNPEAFGGRMKTLSFEMLSSLLFKRENDDDLQKAHELKIVPIDLVVCNLYPFKEVAKSGEQTEEKLIENIDIGGPTMIRAAAKNFSHVAVLVDPKDYNEFQCSFQKNNGALMLNFRKELALKAFSYTASYDAFISNTFSNTMPKFADFTLNNPLRYGENPHQKAVVCLNEHRENSLSSLPLLHGKALSYNNYLDADAALNCCRDLHRQFTTMKSSVIVKHLNPCGMASALSFKDSLQNAWAGDPISAFGSIICVNFKIDKDLALFFKDKFIEIILACGFTDEALEVLRIKKNLRLLDISTIIDISDKYEMKSIDGGFLLQETDHDYSDNVDIVTDNKILQIHHDLICFGQVSCKHLKSNAIALVCKDNENISLVGAGMGNPNRIISTQQAILKARQNEVKDFKEVLLVSDAFFPFADNIELAANEGIEMIVQPGGSIRDDKVIAKANQFKISMALTHRRHFKH